MSSQRLKQLQEILAQYPYHKKVLLTSSYAQGHQWLEQQSRTNGHVLNITVETPRTLALKHGQLRLKEIGLQYTSADEIFWIVFSLMREMALDNHSYVSASMLTPGVVRCFSSAISELRHAKVHSAQLDPLAFENPEKGTYVQKLLSLYESYMTDNKRVDDAELRLYVEPDPLPNVHYIIDQHIRLTAAEEESLSVITHNRLFVLESDVPFTADESGFPFAATSFFHALGPVAEVREVLRRIAEQDVSFDEVEIIASDYVTYASAIHSAVVPLSISCTFSQGIPMSFTKAGKAASLYFDWLESGYNLDPVLQAFKLGMLRLSSENESVSNNSLIKLLEKSGIGWSRERYSLLQGWKKGNEQEEHYRTAVNLLSGFFDGLFAVMPKESEIWSPKNVLDGLLRFLDAVPASGEQDLQFRSSIQQLQKTLTKVPVTAMEQANVIRFTRDLVNGIAIASNGVPSEGKMHVSSLHDGGQSGRRYTFILGMDEKNWSAAGSQDPILLDTERTRISPDLLTSMEKASMRELERAGRLAMIDGYCTLSFNSYRLADNQEVNPAFELLQVFRQSSGNAVATYDHLFSQIGQPIGFVHSPSPVSLDAQELWIKRLTAGNGHFYAGRSDVLASFPHLADGERAVAARQDLAVTQYDGVFDPVAGWMVMESISVSKLELYGRCPLQYFYQEVLGIKPKEIATFDRTRWLDAAQRGSLLHAIFQQYLSETNESGGTHDYARLKRITEEAIRKLQQEVPAPSVHVMLKEIDDIHKDVKIFWEGERQRNSTPKFMELALHGKDGLFQVELGKELVLPLKGYVDRVDLLRPGQYKIIDYKTGNPRKFKENEYFSKGTQLQHAIYSIAVEQWLRKTGTDQQAQVVEASYYFPTFKGQGHEVSRIQNRREETARLVSLMTTAMRQGLFPPARDTANCNWCDYKSVCGNHAEHMKDKRNDPTNGERLSIILEVENYD